jgi:hypothetical protein
MKYTQEFVLRSIANRVMTPDRTRSELAGLAGHLSRAERAGIAAGKVQRIPFSN